MKKICYFATVLLLFVSCSSQDDDDLDVTALNVLGEWKLVESYIDPGDGSGSYQNVENGYEFTLRSDGTFTSGRLRDIFDRGTYRLEDNEKLIFLFNCPDFNDEYTDVLRFNGRKLVLSPLFPIACIEGCSYRFRKQ